MAGIVVLCEGCDGVLQLPQVCHLLIPPFCHWGVHCCSYHTPACPLQATFCHLGLLKEKVRWLCITVGLHINDFVTLCVTVCVCGVIGMWKQVSFTALRFEIPLGLILENSLPKVEVLGSNPGRYGVQEITLYLINFQCVHQLEYDASFITQYSPNCIYLVVVHRV